MCILIEKQSHIYLPIEMCIFTLQNLNKTLKETNIRIILKFMIYG